MDDLLKVDEVAEWLRVSRSSIRNYIERGYFPAIKIGSSTRIKRSAVEDWLQRCTIEPSDKKDGEDE
jgi:excisionase family DNA binding protein